MSSDTKPSTAEEDQIRYTLLIKVVDKALQRSVEILSLDNLLKCYPSFDTRQGIKYLNTCIKQINGFFLDSCQKEIQLILAEKGLKQKLDKLDQNIKEAQDNMNAYNSKASADSSVQPIFIESLSNSYLIEYNLYVSKLDYYNLLVTQYQRVKGENEAALQQLQLTNDQNDKCLKQLENCKEFLAVMSLVQLED